MSVESYAAKHEAAGLEFLRATKDAVADYERRIAQEQSADERKKLRRALDMARRALGVCEWPFPMPQVLEEIPLGV